LFNLFKKLFYGAGKTNYRELMMNGAIIVDVRTPGEFASGHIPKSINIPFDQLKNQLSYLSDKQKPIICCCASGVRSGAARRILALKGYKNVYNGGRWRSLKKQL